MQPKIDLEGYVIAPTPMEKPSRWLINALGFITCALLLAYAYYLQFYYLLAPCPLCSLQRLAMAALGLVFIVAAVHNPNGRGARVYSILIALVALVGATIAARHVWLQYFALEHMGACLPGLDYLLASFPLIEVTRLILLESGDCSGIDWTFLNLSIPVWSLIAFLGLGTIGAVRSWMRY